MVINMQEIKVSFESEGLQLQGCLELPQPPDRAVGSACPGVLLCHPHPLYGGSMDSNVIIAVSHALAARGAAALRFNFRGVGQSQGSFAEGIGELADAFSALSYLSEREEIDKNRIGITGYSFGGMIAFSAGAKDARVKAVAGISPVLPAGCLRGLSKPALIIYGTGDDVVPAATIIHETKKMAFPGKVVAISGADHFWWGYEKEVAEKVADFMVTYLTGNC